ncbi:MAG TPA: pantoate--beta-alanine ligase [Chloroflexota bacterium]|nr:pantoate--beta-alanine ligase [Chloroflexota bacterium]
MKLVREPSELSNMLGKYAHPLHTVGLVPTMGALHAAHMRLLEVCRLQNDLVVLSVYVNPSQFGPREDLTRYPRDLERDSAMAKSAGCDVLFAPSDGVMYPNGVEGQSIWIDPGELGRHLEGDSRPGHFRGVATVVHKLFEMVRPDRAYFGQKDIQQALIISRMVDDLGMTTKIHTIPTVREKDGVALSSRNVFLTAVQRGEAPSLKAALDAALDAWRNGTRDAPTLEKIARRVLSVGAPSGAVDYVSVASTGTLKPVVATVSEPAVIALAVRFGGTRLIDNELLQP